MLIARCSLCGAVARGLRVGHVIRWRSDSSNLVECKILWDPNASEKDRELACDSNCSKMRAAMEEALSES
jgi:hypothetical protein